MIGVFDDDTVILIQALLEPRIDRFAFERQHAKCTFVNPPQRLLPNEAFQAFDAERKLPQCQRALRR